MSKVVRAFDIDELDTVSTYITTEVQKSIEYGIREKSYFETIQGSDYGLVAINNLVSMIMPAVQASADPFHVADILGVFLGAFPPRTRLSKLAPCILK